MDYYCLIKLSKHDSNIGVGSLQDLKIFKVYYPVIKHKPENQPELWSKWTSLQNLQ